MAAAAHTGPLNDENRRITQQAVTKPDLELGLCGTEARSIQVTEHNGIPDVILRCFTVSLAAPELSNNGAAKLGEPRIAHFWLPLPDWASPNAAKGKFGDFRLQPDPSAQREPVL